MIVSNLTMFYTLATFFIGLTREDNYPTSFLESFSCGTPVITHDTGGCKESVESEVGDS